MFASIEFTNKSSLQNVQNQIPLDIKSFILFSQPNNLCLDEPGQNGSKMMFNAHQQNKQTP